MERLAVCPACHLDFVWPVDHCEEGIASWRVVLRCGNCGTEREGVWQRKAVECFDEERDIAEAQIRADLKAVTHANMAELADTFASALAADAILPEDFC